jgi:hypothetical protein
MKRKLKVAIAVPAALVALFVMAGTASAAEFHSAVEPTFIHGGQTTLHKFKTTAGEATCETGTASGTATKKTQPTLGSLSLSWSGCHLIIFGSTISLTINQNGCTFLLYASGTADIVCAAGKEIEMTGAGCTIKIPGQTGLKSVTYANKENHILGTANVTNLKYSHSGFTCGTGSATTGTYTGTSTVRGYEGSSTAGTPVKIWWE